MIGDIVMNAPIDSRKGVKDDSFSTLQTDANLE